MQLYTLKIHTCTVLQFKIYKHYTIHLTIGTKHCTYRNGDLTAQYIHIIKCHTELHKTKPYGSLYIIYLAMYYFSQKS